MDDQKFSLNGPVSSESENEKVAISEDLVGLSQKNSELFVQDTLMACKDLGFKESEILPIISSVMKTGGINSSEELIQMVLKGL